MKTSSGDIKEVLLDYKRQSILSAYIRIIANKELSLEIFMNANKKGGNTINKYKIYSDYRHFLKYKLHRISRIMQYQKFNMAIKLRCLNGLSLLNSILRRIEIAKEMFLLDV